MAAGVLCYHFRAGEASLSLHANIRTVGRFKIRFWERYEYTLCSMACKCADPCVIRSFSPYHVS